MVSSDLFLTKGNDLGDAASEFYDFVMSTICMQHIAVHEIRFKILSDMFRVLKPGGWLTIQMGFGTTHPKTVNYYDDNFYATSTNGRMDVRIENPEDVKADLKKIGFEKFEYNIDKSNADAHDQWIYFRAEA